MKTILFYLIIISTTYSLVLSQNSKWTIIDSIRIYNRDSTATAAIFYEKIDCYDELNCAAIGNLFGTSPLNRITSDGGKTWFTTLTDTSSFNYVDSIRYIPAIARSIVYPGKNLCIIGCDSGYYWRSTDYCQTWKRGKLPVIGDDYAINKLSFINEKKGAAIDFEELFLTTDGGETWEKADLKFPDSLVHSYFSDVVVIDDNYIILNIASFQTWKTRIYHSSDFGKTWDYHEPNIFRVLRIDFLNKNRGWAISSRRLDTNKYNYNDVIYRTEDGGKTWELQLDTLSFAYSYPLARIFFSDSLNGFALGYWYKLWRTTDGGKQWVIDEEYKNRITKQFFSDIYSFSKDIFFGITRDMSNIYKYENITSVEEKINKQINEGGFIIRPNPATDFIEISVPDDMNQRFKSLVQDIRIYNVFGQEVNLTPTLSKHGEGENNPLNPPLLRGNLRIDVSSLPPGVYFVRVGGRVGKFLKI